MNAPAMDLLLRVVGERLREQTCSRCAQPLTADRAVVRSFTGGELVVEVACPECREPNQVRVRPEIEP